MAVTHDDFHSGELQRAAGDLFDPVDWTRITGSTLFHLTRQWWRSRQLERAERRAWKEILDDLDRKSAANHPAPEPTVPLPTVAPGSDGWREGRYRFKQDRARFPYWVERVDC